MGSLSKIPKRYELLTRQRKVCLSRTTSQRDRLRKNAMGVLTAVSRFLNALAPINKLPPEILGMIPKYEDDQTPKHLVAVSSVCSYWRNAFIAAPCLWTRLGGKGLERESYRRAEARKRSRAHQQTPARDIGNTPKV